MKRIFLFLAILAMSACGNEKAALTDEHPQFPIPHNGVSECVNCHPVSYFEINCQTCHAHSQQVLDPLHMGVGGYVFEAEGCFNCHPDGKR